MDLKAQWCHAAGLLNRLAQTGLVNQKLHPEGGGWGRGPGCQGEDDTHGTLAMALAGR